MTFLTPDPWRLETCLDTEPPDTQAASPPFNLRCQPATQ